MVLGVFVFAKPVPPLIQTAKTCCLGLIKSKVTHDHLDTTRDYTQLFLWPSSSITLLIGQRPSSWGRFAALKVGQKIGRFRQSKHHRKGSVSAHSNLSSPEQRLVKWTCLHRCWILFCYKEIAKSCLEFFQHKRRWFSYTKSCFSLERGQVMSWTQRKTREQKMEQHLNISEGENSNSTTARLQPKWQDSICMACDILRTHCA